ncbi:winged helix-turn-helix transcriptional regulator [Rhodococcoides fascians A21d2]|uniref:MarR family winged helix-turn-helix transcriptional regulator n=1 Tax=Rhodococcoides fascians TaxID=1828 RepID=UPI00050CF49A|nr:MarR family transcriptional regulator [Rhodococcus fascians]QII00350.1 winged helix-turn-helix transcriptional regulator [Rhodococcus fascians A21d2]
MATDLEVLGQTIKRAQYRNHRAMDAALREIGVSLVQWDALRAIDRMPGASGHELAVTTFQSDQAFGTLAGRLEERGLIRRSSGRGRRVEHVLTDAGVRALTEGRQLTRETLEGLFAPLGEVQRRELLRTLRNLTEEP